VQLFLGQDKKLSSLHVFLVAALSKLVATVITFPLILAKSRLQAQIDRASVVDDSSTYKNTLDVIRKVVAEEGLLGLYRGIQSKALQTTLNSAFQFAFKDAFDKISFAILLWLLKLRNKRNQRS
jgi:adenine nucleotide transporter 17